MIKLGDGWPADHQTPWTAYCQNDLTVDQPFQPTHTAVPHPDRDKLDKLEPNTADLRVDHHLWGDWTFMGTSMFLTLNWCLASEYVSLALTWHRTNSSQLTRERSRVYRRWAYCWSSKARLHRSSNQGLSLLRDRLSGVLSFVPAVLLSILTPLLAIFMARDGLIVLFKFCCAHARVFEKTLVHEFPISYSHTEWYFIFSLFNWCKRN